MRDVREGRIAPERGAKVARLLEAALELARERDAILSALRPSRRRTVGSERNGGYFAGGWVGAHPAAGDVVAVLQEGVTYATRDVLEQPRPKRGRGQRRNRHRACTRSSPCAGCVARDRVRP